MNREETPGKSPEEMYIQQKVRVLLMLKKMGSNLTQSEEAFLRNYAGVVHSQMSQLPQHPIDQGKPTLRSKSLLQGGPGMKHEVTKLHKTVDKQVTNIDVRPVCSGRVNRGLAGHG
ncbi:beta-catenin-interacting protein 1 isoform X1 [Anguilla rostrata]|uniref:beta-catenin-interacting protein 1 isoform X1 n=1 Tax=Anguilla rostrata TaxID=7938 RepID=UPI0030CCB3B5